MDTNLFAITRPVSASIERCELGYLPRRSINALTASEQHTLYEACLSELGLALIRLPAEPELPDAVFVEDTAVVVPELAIMTRPGAASRRPEVESVARALSRYRPLRWLQEPATLDGGDVMHAGRKLFVGASPQMGTVPNYPIADRQPHPIQSDAAVMGVGRLTGDLRAGAEVPDAVK